MTLAEVATAAGGTLAAADPGARVTGEVEIDSRRVGPGGLFAAFPGERADGHDFAAGAVAAGAVAVLGSRDLPGIPMVRVADPRAALGRLARAVLDRLPGVTVIGVTGSSGKTTTKDLLAQLTAELGPTVAPTGSLNNELGLPYTVLRSGPDTRYLVLEMAARGGGDIAYLCTVAPPRIGVVLNVGVAHLGEFGSVAAIAAAKGELPAALPADGLAVLPVDLPEAAGRTAAREVRFGAEPSAEVRADRVRLDARGRPAYTLVTPEGSAPVRLDLTGAHQVANTLAVAAVGRELGLAPEAVAAALGRLRIASPRRMHVVDRDDGVTVIDDSYNANPASTGAALRALAAMAAGRRAVAVLGYLAELGEYERAGHEEVGALAAELGVARLAVVGEAAAPIHDGALAARDRHGWEGESVVVPDQDAAVRWLDTVLRPGDVVLVKGSRYQTWQVADWVRDGAGDGAAVTGGAAAGAGGEAGAGR